jgi:arsenite oxidase small subunit
MTDQLDSTTRERERRGAGRLSRREVIAAGAAVAVLGGGEAATAAKPPAYPRLRVVELAKLKRNRPVAFDYPLEGQASVLLDFGRSVPGGVGPKKGIVAYSTLCQHMGCGVAYQARLRELVCPCHQTRYDPEREGSIIQGVATRALPRILLKVENGAVWAVGVDGLIYGYRSNLRPGQRVGGAS